MNAVGKPSYKMLFNHDGYCVFQQASRYQDVADPVRLEQVHGYVDEVAESGCDVLLLSPMISKIPAWPSRAYPHWKEQAGADPVSPDTPMDVTYNRLKDFMDAGGDLVGLSAERAKSRGLSFFISWRMNEGHDVRRGSRSPIQSRFWHENPQYRIGGAEARTLWGRALDFSHQAVRDYQFDLIRELCTEYPIDGLELDFLRFAKYFPSTTPRAERFRILCGFVERVRRMLDDISARLPLCVRVQNRLDLVQEMGLDLSRCVREGWVNMINLAPFIVSEQDVDIETFREAFPETALYGEITHCTHYGKLIQTGVFTERLITHEIILSTARSFIERGCDGISTFNYSYTRDFTCGHTPPAFHHEPDFSALRAIASRQKLSGVPAHYVLGDDRYARQVPTRLNVEDEKTFRLYVADPGPADAIGAIVFRVEAEASSPAAEFEAVMDEKVLEPLVLDGPLFPAHDRPADAQHRGDFRVPRELLKAGWNEIGVRLVSTPMVTIQRVELALFERGSKACAHIEEPATVGLQELNV